MQEWYGVIASLGWSGGESRLTALCEWIVRNDLFEWTQLEHAGDPKDWPGASEFQSTEINALRHLALIGKEEPKYAYAHLVRQHARSTCVARGHPNQRTRRGKSQRGIWIV